MASKLPGDMRDHRAPLAVMSRSPSSGAHSRDPLAHPATIP
jgi:hypothetical protein